jgi:hypothetical protein
MSQVSEADEGAMLKNCLSPSDRWFLSSLIRAARAAEKKVEVVACVRSPLVSKGVDLAAARPPSRSGF